MSGYGKLVGRETPGNPWAEFTPRPHIQRMPTVSRHGRLIDLSALLCIVVGAGLYLVAAMQLREIGKLSYQNPGPAQQSALTVADRARYLSYAGVALVVIGFIVGTAGAIGHARAHRVS